MNAPVRCLAILTICFAFSITGILAHQLFHDFIAAAADTIRSVAGLVGTLFAIVLGLLISSSYSAFNSHQADFNTMATSLANIDLLLKRFNEDSRKSRHSLSKIASSLKSRYWKKDSASHRADIDYNIIANDVDSIVDIIKNTEKLPSISTDDINAIRQFSNSFITTQSNIVRNLVNRVQSLLLLIVSGWACLLFFLFGCLSSTNPFSLFILFTGALAIASANFLILELTHPYHGLFRVSSATLDLLTQAMHETPDTVAPYPFS